MCSDAAAEAARYGFTAVDRPEGFLVLAVASLGEQVTELDGAPEVLLLVFLICLFLSHFSHGIVV